MSQNPGAGALTYFFADGNDALTACLAFYDDDGFCDAFHKDTSNRVISSNAKIIGDRQGAVFLWGNQSCQAIADTQTLLDGHATYLGECLRADADALSFSRADVAELSGFILLSWVIGYIGGLTMLAIKKAIESI